TLYLLSTSSTEFHPLSLHDALPIFLQAPLARTPDVVAVDLRRQRAFCSCAELTQPRLPTSSSTSHIAPSLTPVGYSSMPGSRSRTAPPVPSADFSSRPGRARVTACAALAAEASAGRPPSSATRSE